MALFLLRLFITSVHFLVHITAPFRIDLPLKIKVLFIIVYPKLVRIVGLKNSRLEMHLTSPNCLCKILEIFNPSLVSIKITFTNIIPMSVHLFGLEMLQPMFISWTVTSVLSFDLSPLVPGRQFHPYRWLHTGNRQTPAVSELSALHEDLRGCTLHHRSQHGSDAALRWPGDLCWVVLEPWGRLEVDVLLLSAAQSLILPYMKMQCIDKNGSEPPCSSLVVLFSSHGFLALEPAS